MPIKRSYLKTKNVCRVTFNLQEPDASKVCIVGDFNDWDKEAVPMRKGRQGFSATMDLQPGREYQFRYLIDGQKWANDEEADHHTETPFPDARNSVIRA